MQCAMRFFSTLSPRITGFNHRPFHTGVLVSKPEMGQVFIQIFRFWWGGEGVVTIVRTLALNDVTIVTHIVLTDVTTVTSLASLQ